MEARAFLPGGDPRDALIMEISSQTILNWIIQYGYIGLFCLLMLGIVGVPFPDELIMTCAGYLIFKGYLQPGPTIIAAFLGSVCGISLSYTIGRVVGTSLIDRYGNRFHVTPEKLKSINEWFERFGKWTLVFGYFLTGFQTSGRDRGGHSKASDAGVCSVRVYGSIDLVGHIHFARVFSGGAVDPHRRAR